MREPARETEAPNTLHLSTMKPLILLSLQSCSLAWSGVEQAEPSVPAIS